MSEEGAFIQVQIPFVYSRAGTDACILVESRISGRSHDVMAAKSQAVFAVS